MPNDTYVIPNYDQAGSGWLKLFLLGPVAMVGLGAIVYAKTHSVAMAIEWAVYGLIAGVLTSLPVFILVAITVGSKYRRLEQENRTKHSFSWYRQTFPENAHPNGHVSCRHCGSHKTRVDNMLKHTYTRLHSCAQCGETLYYSAEKR